MSKINKRRIVVGRMRRLFGAALMIACEQAPQWGQSAKINQRAERSKILFTGYAYEIFWLLNAAALIRGRRFFE